MTELNSYAFIVVICLLIITSYLYNIVSRKTGIPSVLLLLLSGIGVRELLVYKNAAFAIPQQVVEMFGIVGLIMIMLEAGLDLNVSRKKLKLIRNAFLSALFILLLSVLACSGLLFWYLKEDYLRCVIYSIPLSVVSSAIVIPSISHLNQMKQEFLIYETSFSDIIGILVFNYMIAGNLISGTNIAWFFGSIIFTVIISLLLSFFMLLMLTRITTKVRFFLVLAVLIFLYAGGKLLHLPALFIILLFGLVISNWQLPLFRKLNKWISYNQVSQVSHLMHSLTAECSFLIRTFFFFIFGLTIDVRLLLDIEVALTGASIVLLLLGIRYVYLRFFLRSHIFPELFYMPRGLITVLLFYSIPEIYKLTKFNEGVLFFVILVTSIIMLYGSVFWKKAKVQTINDEMPLMDEN